MIKVLFGGAFDLLHRGHIEAIKKARTYGDYLVIGVSSDARIKAKKGNLRPIIPEEDRIEIVRNIKGVNKVVCLRGESEYPFFKLLYMVKPDIVVVDSTEHQNLEKERKVCEEKGIQLKTFDRIITESKLDTSNIINKILYGQTKNRNSWE